jgi:hypothetical protein
MLILSHVIVAKLEIGTISLLFLVGADNLASSHVVRSTRAECKIGSPMTVPKQTLEAVRQLYRRYTGTEISLEEVEELGEYIIWWVCAVHDI